METAEESYARVLAQADQAPRAPRHGADATLRVAADALAGLGQG